MMCFRWREVAKGRRRKPKGAHPRRYMGLGRAVRLIASGFGRGGRRPVELRRLNFCSDLSARLRDLVKSRTMYCKPIAEQSGISDVEGWDPSIDYKACDPLG